MQVVFCSWEGEEDPATNDMRDEIQCSECLEYYPPSLIAPCLECDKMVCDYCFSVHYRGANYYDKPTA